MDLGRGMNRSRAKDRTELIATQPAGSSAIEAENGRGAKGASEVDEGAETEGGFDEPDGEHEGGDEEDELVELGREGGGGGLGGSGWVITHDGIGEEEEQR